MSDSSTEKRDSSRTDVGSARTGRLVSRIPGDCVDVKIRNICSTGIGFILNQAVDTTQVHALAIQSVASSSVLEIEIRAVYCVEGKDGPYILGAKFMRELSDAELADLISL